MVSTKSAQGTFYYYTHYILHVIWGEKMQYSEYKVETNDVYWNLHLW